MIRMQQVAAITAFSALVFGGQSRVMAQIGGGGGPIIPPIIAYANAESGLQGCDVSDGWSAEVTWTGDDIDTDNETYFSNSCSGNSANGGASYNSTLTLQMQNNTLMPASGTWSGQRNVEGNLETMTDPHFAHSSVIAGPENLLYDETSLPDKTMYHSYFVNDDTFTTGEVNSGYYQTFSNFFTLEGAAG